MTLTVALITANEELNIRECMENVKWADEIVIVDSGSKDKTQAISKEFTPNVFEIPFENFAKQKNAALAKATMDWIFLIDADERMTEELKAEIKSIVRLNDKSSVYQIHRRTFFFGEEMKYGGVQDDFPIRLFPRGTVRYERPVHEQIVTQLKIRKTENCLLHYSTRDRAHYQQKLDCYIPFEIEFMKARGLKVSFFDMLTRPFLKFIFIYFFKSGFLDLGIGFEYARLSAYYEYLKCKGYREGIA